MHIIARTIKHSLSQTSIPLVLTPLARQRRNTLWVTSRISCRESQSGAKATKKQHMVVATGNLSSRHSHESHWAPNCKWLSAKLEVLSGRITLPYKESTVQLLVGMQVLPDALRCLYLLRCKAGEEQESAQLPDVLPPR